MKGLHAAFGSLVLLACANDARQQATAPVPPSPEAPDAAAVTAPSTPTSEAMPPAPAGRWMNETPETLRTIDPGVVDAALLPNGEVVAAVSYASDSEPFVVYSGRPDALTKSVAPFECDASPADLEVSGAHAWVHCLAPGEEMRVQFLHSGDGGRNWTRVAMLPGPIALGSYALAGPTLYVTGKVDGQAADLHRFTVLSGGKVERGAASAKDPQWSQGGKRALVASSDGATVAIVARTETLRVARSADGGKSVVPLEGSIPWTTGGPILNLSLVEETLWIGHDEGGAVTAIAKVSLTGNAARADVVSLEQPPKDLCLHGARVAAKLADGHWGVSTDGGETFSPIPAPTAAESSQALQCSADGARLGDELYRWP